MIVLLVDNLYMENIASMRFIYNQRVEFDSCALFAIITMYGFFFMCLSWSLNASKCAYKVGAIQFSACARRPT